MKYQVLDARQTKEWNDFLKRLPRSRRDNYFTPEYCALSQLNGEGQAKCFCYEEKGEAALYPFVINEIQGYQLDKKYYDIETPYGYGGPILSSDDEGIRSSFEECFLGYCRDNNIVAEFIRFHPLIKNHSTFKKQINIELNRHTVHISLCGGMEHIWNKEISSKNRNMIRKAENSGIDVRVMEETQFHVFKEIYLSTMEKLSAASYYSFSHSYFSALKELAKAQGVILGAYYMDRVIACAVFLYYEDYFNYHLSGSVGDYLNLAPNNILLYEASKIAIQKGCSSFHLGGGRSSHEEDSLLKFKKSFSGNINDFYIGKRVHDEKVYNYLIGQWESRYRKKKSIFLQYKTEG